MDEGNIVASLVYEKSTQSNGIESYSTSAKFDSQNKYIDFGKVYLNGTQLTKVYGQGYDITYSSSQRIPFEPNAGYVWKIENPILLDTFSVNITAPNQDLEIIAPAHLSTFYTNGDLQVLWNKPPWKNSYIEIILIDNSGKGFRFVASDDGNSLIPLSQLDNLSAGNALISVTRFTYKRIAKEYLHPDSYCSIKLTSYRNIILKHPDS